MKRRPSLLPVLVAMLWLCGCDRPRAGADSPPPEPAAASGAEAAPSDAVPDPSPAPESEFAPRGKVAVALDPEGIRFFDSATGASRLLAFGVGQPATVAALSAALGAEPIEQAEVDDCNASHVRWGQGLGAWFTVGHFAGWSVGDGASGLATAAGVKPGSTRAELESAYDATVFESSLGTEFTAGEMGGVLDSHAADARVIHLWAGSTCIAR